MANLPYQVQAANDLLEGKSLDNALADKAADLLLSQKPRLFPKTATNSQLPVSGSACLEPAHSLNPPQNIADYESIRPVQTSSHQIDVRPRTRAGDSDPSAGSGRTVLSLLVQLQLTETGPDDHPVGPERCNSSRSCFES
jgi:hypothetical protein